MMVRDISPQYLVRPTTSAYKRTDAGVIPQDWLTPSCDDLIDRASPICYGVVQVGSHEDGGVPIIAIKFLKKIASAPLHRASPTIERAYSRSRVKPGDVLISIKGTIGRVGVVPRGFEGNISRELARLRPKAGMLPGYIAQQLESDGAQERISRAVVGTTRLEFSIAALRKFEIPVPPTEAEQLAITETLADVDGLLGALEALIAKKRAIKQAAMQQLLTGKTRLPGFSGEWETKRLGKIGDFLKGSGVKREDAQSGPLACVRYGEIYTTHDDYIRTFHSWISPEVASTATRLEFGDLLFAGSGETREEIGKCVAFVTDGEAYAGGDIVILRPGEADPLFLGYALNTPDVVRQKASLGQGDAVVHISAAALAQVSLAAPLVDEQIAIAAVLSDMDAEITALEARRDKTRAIKQGMMQQLLTGRVRLIEPEVSSAA